MGDTVKQRPVLLIAAVFSRHAAALEWARARFAAAWGAIKSESPLFEHRETTYYEASMGADLQKMFLVSEQLIDPGQLPELKLTANRWEEEYRALGNHGEARPLNIDPGYLTEAKLVLASTKDRDHRIYLSQGIFAEVTLHYARGTWQTRPWTYPDYQRADYHAYFTTCREYLRQRYREGV
ncbi:hypothetical protein ETAA8_15450 [Anatilimnocola aggregata]|uniref:GTP-binding protein n=1 Tax=Anatilimnocola aggregata TaxID=2528021 RepID=A0A517Y8A0_9BACT|nr:DUF4416 family protein [Anatilimnocola aggregata]QDU26467.1 hypothetical protein ETAA8_15450 [Anatilimnocola aggregata]